VNAAEPSARGRRAPAPTLHLSFIGAPKNLVGVSRSGSCLVLSCLVWTTRYVTARVRCSVTPAEHCAIRHALAERSILMKGVLLECGQSTPAGRREGVQLSSPGHTFLRSRALSRQRKQCKHAPRSAPQYPALHASRREGEPRDQSTSVGLFPMMASDWFAQADGHRQQRPKRQGRRSGMCRAWPRSWLWA
jgi:hypothetical protein